MLIFVLKIIPVFLFSVDTLRLTHLAGKQAVNIFTTTHAMTWQEEISHPAVGFKAHLIRLIGNLCYKNKENQDKVSILTSCKTLTYEQMCTSNYDFVMVLWLLVIGIPHRNIM